MGSREDLIRNIADEDYRAALEDSSSHLRYQVEFSQAALKSMLLVNGGAIIALLTFVGNRGSEFAPNDLKWSIGLFCAGLSLAMLAHIPAYIAQSYYHSFYRSEAWYAQSQAKGLVGVPAKESDLKWGNGMVLGASTMLLFSLFSFVAGAFFALDAVT